MNMIPPGHFILVHQFRDWCAQFRVCREINTLGTGNIRTPASPRYGCYSHSKKKFSFLDAGDF